LMHDLTGIFNISRIPPAIPASAGVTPQQ